MKRRIIQRNKTKKKKHNTTHYVLDTIATTNNVDNTKGQSRETANIRRRKKKQKKNTTQYLLDTTIPKQPQIM